MNRNLLENYISNPEQLLKKARSKLKKTPPSPSSEDSTPRKSLTSKFEAMATKTL